MDTILKRIIERQIPYLIGGAITGIIITYYYGFLFSLVVNSAIWTVVSFAVSKFYYEKNSGFTDQKYLLRYAKSLIAPKE
jgi:ABC-type transport system involved in Fe-S cluster assembly fused permease/ATPase subunit